MSLKYQSVLFLCTGNSIRSQMAEALMRRHGPRTLTVLSAGVAAAGIHPLTYLIMREEGMDLAGHRSKSVQDIPLEEVDYVITLCDHAQKTCPAGLIQKPGEHWSIRDPISLAGGEAMTIARFRETRDELRERIQAWLTQHDR